MPRDEHRPELSQRWLDNARADLILARVELPPGGLMEHLCYHAQQAAEKSLKAVLLSCHIDIPFTHNIQALIDRLPEDLKGTREILEAVILTPYASTTRYPGEMEPVTEEDY